MGTINLSLFQRRKTHYIGLKKRILGAAIKAKTVYCVGVLISSNMDRVDNRIGAFGAFISGLLLLGLEELFYHCFSLFQDWDTALHLLGRHVDCGDFLVSWRWVRRELRWHTILMESHEDETDETEAMNAPLVEQKLLEFSCRGFLGVLVP